MTEEDVKHQKTATKYGEDMQTEKFGSGALISDRNEEVVFDGGCSSSSVIGGGGSSNKLKVNN